MAVVRAMVSGGLYAQPTGRCQCPFRMEQSNVMRWSAYLPQPKHAGNPVHGKIVPVRPSCAGSRRVAPVRAGFVQPAYPPPPPRLARTGDTPEMDVLWRTEVSGRLLSGSARTPEAQRPFARCISTCLSSRSASRFLMSSRLSYSALPLPTASWTFTKLPFQ